MLTRMEGPTSPDPQLVVAIDGPGSSGKSSVGSAAALAVGYRFCDTGLLYRALTWLALAGHVRESDPASLVALVPQVRLVADEHGRLHRVVVDDRDVTAEVHGALVDERVSNVAKVPEVRAAFLPVQRALATTGGIVMAGRDIGTVVLPGADLKIFLDASVEERARRRAEERGLDPASPEARWILAELGRRDEIDANRSVAPLRPAPDARHVRTDGNTFEETVAAVVAEIRAAEQARALHPDATGSAR
jgi:cytidylate kinase